MQLLQLIPKACICTATPLSLSCAAWTLLCNPLPAASRDRAAPLPLKQTKDRPCRIPMNCSRLKETASPPHLEDEILRGNVFNAIPRKDFWRWWAFQRLHWIDLHQIVPRFSFLSEEKTNWNQSCDMTWPRLNLELHSNQLKEKICLSCPFFSFIANSSRFC